MREVIWALFSVIEEGLVTDWVAGGENRRFLGGGGG